MRALQTCFDQVPSSAYNQTVQRAIKEDDDRLGDVWRPRRRLDTQRQEMNQAAAVRRLPVAGANLPPLLATGMCQPGLEGIGRPRAFASERDASTARRERRWWVFGVQRRLIMFLKERNTHYSDGKQLACCQLAAGFIYFFISVKCRRQHFRLWELCMKFPLCGRIFFKSMLNKTFIGSCLGLNQ